MNTNPWPYQYAIVPLDQIFVDHRYQRPSIPNFVQLIVDTFRPELVVVLVVSQRRDGRYALIDGQQRWLALRELGHTNVPAIVYTGLSYKAEAALFAAFFERKNMHPWYLYRAEREAGDQTTLAVDAIVERHGLVVGHSVQSEPMIGSPSTLVSIYRGDSDVVRGNDLAGAEVLDRTLDTICQAWRGWAVSWTEAKTGGMLRGVARWISVNPTVPADELGRKVLRTVEPSALHQSAKELQAGGSGSGKGRMIEAAIERLYVRHGDRRLRAAS